MDNYDYDQVEAQEMAESTKNVLAGVVVGGLIGAAVMLLLAPRSGEETRADIKEKATNLRDRTTESVRGTVSQVVTRAGDLKGRSQEFKQRGQDALLEQLERVSEAVEAAKRVLRDI